MVDTPKTPVTADDFDNMSDEDFLKLDESQFGGDAPEHAASLTDESLNAENPDNPDEDDDATGEGVDPDQPPADSGEPDGSGDDSDPDAGENQGEEDPDAQGGTGIDPMAEAAGDKASTPETPDGEQPNADAKKEGEKAPDAEGSDKAPVKAGKFKLPEGMTAEQATSALAFYSQITAPFKADGRDFQVRSAEDAIKLMQRGVNYSRRMQELKPMKAMNRMLTDHGLNDPAKMSFLIDVAKGDKTAITKLLKDNNLDPMDLDVQAEVGYQAKSYAGNPQDNAFRDAIENLTTNPEGQALVSEIHGTWDDTSKVKLREKPEILGNLLELKQSGVYQQVVDELQYQRSMGYLTHTPFLEAFDQVGEAMKNAGVLKVGNQPQPAPAAQMGNLQQQPTSQPVASGARKAPAQKKALPNPHLSSTPPSKQSAPAPASEPDFGKMSDEDFLKLPPPE